MVPVASTTGFVVGQPVWIGDVGGTFEVRIIQSISAGVSLTMTANLTNTYAAGKVVSGSPAELVAARNAYATLDARLDANDTLVADMPLGQLGYAEVTAGQGSIGAANVDLTGLTTTVTVGTSRRIRVRGDTMFLCDAADSRVQLEIYEGATRLQARALANPLVNTAEGLSAERILTPSAGAHTYKLSAIRNGASGTAALQASATFPSFIVVEDIGAA